MTSRFLLLDPSVPPPPGMAGPPLLLLAETRLRDEVIRFYRGAWVAVIQPDGSFEIARMD